ncbi:hypothetical protein EYF80_019232 [Liparis tanakae]|uniref:Uncharacterized protein n=1 Tax=Liparis tanakae TaxID=230148 RepID=A0A4Z2HXS4_9TELE|nr:hypothetical protein EYF80_019232 [Liparis tanakae]
MKSLRASRRPGEAATVSKYHAEGLLNTQEQRRHVFRADIADGALQEAFLLLKLPHHLQLGIHLTKSPKIMMVNGV